MAWIQLENIQFHAPIGVGEEEKVVGNSILVSLGVRTSVEEAGHSDHLEDTVDYEILYQIAASEMESPKNLLETAATHIMDKVLDRFPAVSEVQVKVSKMNPPISGICERATIIVERKR